MENLDLASVNARLRAGGTRVTIKQVNDWLYLRAVLPPKPGSAKVKPFRQEVTQPKRGLFADVSGLRRAETLARALWDDVIENTFDWDVWSGKTHKEDKPVKEWIPEFREHWLSKKKCSKKTWKRHWQRAFDRLPQEEFLSAQSLLNVIRTIKPDSRELKRSVEYFQRLADYAGLTIDLSPYKGNYQTGHSEVPRDLPKDEVIAEWFHRIPNPQWRWVYGVVACLGIRPHEAFFLKPTEDPLIWDVLDGKTGPYQASALYPEWVQEWELLNGEPPPLKYEIDGKPDFQRYGAQISHQMAIYGLPFAPYNLRHAFAVRCIKFTDLPTSIAAKMMGHSEAIHKKTYHRWLSAADQKAAYRQAISSGPKAPDASQEDASDV